VIIATSEVMTHGEIERYCWYCCYCTQR